MAAGSRLAEVQEVERGPHHGRLPACVQQPVQWFVEARRKEIRNRLIAALRGRTGSGFSDRQYGAVNLRPAAVRDDGSL